MMSQFSVMVASADSLEQARVCKINMVDGEIPNIKI